MTPLSVMTIAAAASLLLLPGAAVGYALGLRGFALVGLAGPLGVATTAGTSVLLPLLGVSFQWWHGPAVALLALLVSLPLRRVRSPLGVRHLLVLGAIAVSGAVAALVAFSGLPLASVNSTYDGVFHLNAVAYILSNGNGSSFDLYRMTHPGPDLEFYPAAWHDLVAATAQLTGAPVPLATNATWIAVTATVWIPGVVFLATTAFAAGGTLLVALLAAPLATAFAAAPYLLLDWGTLFPTGLAYALLPSGLALLVHLLRTSAPEEAMTRPVIWSTAAFWTVAAGLSHPRSLFGIVVLALPLVAVWGLRQLRAQWSRPERRRRLIVFGATAVALLIAVGVAGWIYVYRTFDVANRPISEHLNGGPATARQGIGESLVQALLNAPVVAPAETAVPAAWVLSALVIAALIVAALRAEWRWAVIGWALAVLLYCLAAGSNSDLAKLATGLWYKDKYRLISLLPVITAPLAAGALALLVRAAVRRLPERRLLVRVGVAALCTGILASAWLGPTLNATRAAVAAVHAVPDGEKAGALLNAGELALLERLPELTPPGSVIVGNPWNGSALTWAIGDREALFPHLTGDWDPDRLVVAGALDTLATDPAVCDALRRLGAGYLLTSPGLLWGGDPQAAGFGGIDRTDPSSIGTEVAREGDAVLYRIDACGAIGDSASAAR